MERADHRHSRKVARRNTGLGRIRTLTMGVAAGAVGAVGVLTGYFAHAIPGKHAAGTTAGRSANGSSGNTGNSGGSSGSTGSVGDSGTSGSSGGLSAPVTAPRRTRSAPQVVSGAS